MSIKALIELDKLDQAKADIKIKVPRRNLLAAFSEGLHAYNQSLGGAPACKLESLTEMEPERLAEVIPAVIQGCRIELRDGYIWGRGAAGGEAMALFESDSPVLYIFNQFNGMQSLAQITQKLTERGWDEGIAFRCARMVFFKLCEARICQPEKPLTRG